MLLNIYKALYKIFFLKQNIKNNVGGKTNTNVKQDPLK